MTSTEAPVSAGPSLSPFAMRRAWLGIDQNPRALEFSQSMLGKVVLHAAFVFLLAISFQLSNAALVLVSATVCAVAAFPTKRLLIITLASTFYLSMRPFRIEGWGNLLNQKAAALPAGLPPLALQLTCVGLFLAFVVTFLHWQRANKDRTAAKRPVITLLAIWATLLIAAWAAPTASLASSVLWTVVGIFISSFWYLAYAAADQKTKDATPTLARASMMRPFWGGSATPIGKGFGYLNKFDAKNDEELAATRLKAIKLTVWALILTGLLKGLEWAFYGQLAIPHLQDAIMAHAGNEPIALGQSWVAVVGNYFFDLLIIAIWGHFIVAAVRMIGYRIPRNTRNPLAARTLADFWNRYFFYFKELLVDFFFYPAFLRYFKTNTKVRIAFATFCAAALGNFLYHFTRETYVFASMPIGEALQIFHSAVFYSLALATGLIVSQWRGAKPKPEDGFLRYEVFPRFNVFAFFCFLKIFDDITGQGSLSDRASFTFSLFGL